MTAPKSPDASRRDVLLGGGALSASAMLVGVGCAGKPGPEDAEDSGAPSPGPERPPEPERWAPAGQEDVEGFAWGVQTTDATDQGCLVSVATTHTSVRMVLVVQEGDGWVQLEEQAGLAVVDGVVQLELLGLQADSAHCVAFWSEVDPSQRSRVARFRTAMAASAPDRVVRFGATSCLGGNRPWPSLSAVAADELDFFCLLGDTIYVDASPGAFNHASKWSEALSQDGLQDLSASTSLVFTWDDHEVGNNWTWEDEDIEALFETGRQWAQRSIPWREGGGPAGLWRVLRWGQVLDLIVLDCRSERREGRYLSEEQMVWLEQTLAESQARFKIILNSVPISDLSPMFGTAAAADRWEGYPEDRARILSFVRDESISGVLWVAGDVHYAAVGKVDAPGGPGADQWEVLAGPGGSLLNVAAELFTGDVPHWETMFAQWNCTVFAADPVLGTLTVQHISDQGETIHEIVLRP